MIYDSEVNDSLQVNEGLKTELASIFAIFKEYCR